MELPIELRNAIEERAALYKQKELVDASKMLTERYKKESGKGKSLVADDKEVTAYAAARMPATYGAVYSALSAAVKKSGIQIYSMLDIGAGTGAASWAAEELLGDISITCAEREDAMLKLGSQLMENGGLKGINWVKTDIRNSNKLPNAQLVVASYSLNELTAGDYEKTLILLWEKTEKMLLIVEPGTPEGFSRLKKAREILISQGGFIAAPCTHEKKCRLSDDDWCHFTCRIARSKLQKALKGGDVPYEDEKFSYLAMVKEECDKASARVLRHPIIESGKITLRLCTPDGIEERIVTRKSNSFKAARKADSGDEFELK